MMLALAGLGYEGSIPTGADGIGDGSERGTTVYIMEGLLLAPQLKEVSWQAYALIYIKKTIILPPWFYSSFPSRLLGSTY